MTFKPGLVCLLVLVLGLQTKAKAKAAQDTMRYQTGMNECPKIRMIMPLETASSSNLKLHAVTEGICQLQTRFDDVIQLLAEIRAADVNF